MPDTTAPEHFSDWNEQMIQRYDPEVFTHHPRSIVRWVENKRSRTVIRALQARPEHRILDVGCGAGHILHELPGEQRHGIDLSEFMVKRAQDRLAGNAKVVRGDAEKLPYDDASFDRVLASSLLSHVLHPEVVIGELKRVTKPGGRIVISICLEDQIEKGLRLARTMKLGSFFSGPNGEPQAYNVEYHLHHFSLKRLREAVGTHLAERSVCRIPFVFPVHAIAIYNR
jgi:ubiquinone/menaquinone biosynthesis C-methylase UbiE